MSRRLHSPLAGEPEEPEELKELTPTPPPANPSLLTKELAKTPAQQTTKIIPKSHSK